MPPISLTVASFDKQRNELRMLASRKTFADNAKQILIFGRLCLPRSFGGHERAELGMGSRYCSCFIIARLVKRWGVDSQTQCVGSGGKKILSRTHVTASGW